MDIEQIVRNAYHVAEIKDISAWVSCFSEDGTFTDEAMGVTYRGPNELGRVVEIYASEIAPELTGHGLPLSKCEAYNHVHDQPYESD